MKTKKITDLNFNMWWYSLYPSIKSSIIFFILKKKNNPGDTVDMEKLISELENHVESALTEPLIKEIRTLDTYIFSSENEHKKMFNFRNIKYLESLKFLNILDANNFCCLKYFKFLNKLESLCICNCHNLKDFTTAPKINNQLSITINESSKIKIDDLHHFINLQEINIFNSSKISLSDSESIENVRTLEISDCEDVDIVINFKNIPYLRTLYIINTTGSITFRNPEYASHIQKLRIHDSAISNPESLKNLPGANSKEEQKVVKTPYSEIVLDSTRVEYETTNTKEGKLTSLI